MLPKIVLINSHANHTRELKPKRTRQNFFFIYMILKNRKKYMQTHLVCIINPLHTRYEGQNICDCTAKIEGN